jgi:hypothetical protein
VHYEARLHRKQRDSKKKSAYRKNKQSAHEKGSLEKLIVSSQIVESLEEVYRQRRVLLKEFKAKVNEKSGEVYVRSARVRVPQLNAHVLTPSHFAMRLRLSIRKDGVTIASNRPKPKNTLARCLPNWMRSFIQVRRKEA